MVKKINILKKRQKILNIFAYILPSIIIFIVLYFNFLPFGYSDRVTLDVGNKDDTSGIFYLEENPNLGERQEHQGSYFREIDGTIHAIYNPRAIMKNVKVSAFLEGEDIFFRRQPNIDFEWDYDWKTFKGFEVETPIYNQFLNGEKIDLFKLKRGETFLILDLEKQFAIEIEYSFTEFIELIEGDLRLEQDEKSLKLLMERDNIEMKYDLPINSLGETFEILVGHSNNEIFLFVNKELIDRKKVNKPIKGISILRNEDIIEKNIYSNYEENVSEIVPKDENGCAYFDGETRLILPDTPESGPFDIGYFAVYLEWIPEKRMDWQQLIGHYNWEILQERDRVTFRIGRMTDGDGPAYNISYDIEPDFFNQKHNLLAIYNPSENGYFELYVDEEFVDRKYIGDKTIWQEYAEGHSLSLGWTPHVYGTSPYFKGSICNARFTTKEISNKIVKFESTEEVIEIPISPLSEKGILSSVEINVEK